MPVRMACELAGLPPSSGYYVGKPTTKVEDAVIEEFLRGCVAKRPRRGFWKCYKLARRMGHLWNHKRVYRVYKLFGAAFAATREVSAASPPACKNRCWHRKPRTSGGLWTLRGTR